MTNFNHFEEFTFINIRDIIDGDTEIGAFALGCHERVFIIPQATENGENGLCPVKLRSWLPEDEIEEGEPEFRDTDCPEGFWEIGDGRERAEFWWEEEDNAWGGKDTVDRFVCQHASALSFRID